MTFHWRLWAVVAVLAAGVCLAADWALTSTPEPAEAGAPIHAPAAASAAAKLAPLRTATRLLALSEQLDRATPRLAAGGCGASGERCAADFECVAGRCLSSTCAAAADRSPTSEGAGGRAALPPCALGPDQLGVCCADKCIALERDPLNCGHCGKGCAPGQTCRAGSCVADACAGHMSGEVCALPAGSDGKCCRGSCTDAVAFKDDAANCGSCGHACAPGLSCQAGLCVEPATGQGPTWTCNDPGHTCPAGQFCVLEACLPQACSDVDGQLCPLGLGGTSMGHCCGKACVDLFEDREHCRSCGTACAAGQSCHGGECGP